MSQVELHDGNVRSDLIKRLVIDSSQSTTRYLVVSSQEKYIAISASAYHLLESIQHDCSYTIIAEKMYKEQQVRVSVEDVERAYVHLLEKIRKIDDAQHSSRSFWLKCRLLPAGWVEPVASRLAFFFHPIAVFSWLSSCLILSAYAVEHDLLHHISLPGWQTALCTYLLFLLSLAFHEFGHASACTLGKVKPGEIGFAIYLFFPVFYSNVSSSWQLNKWRRLVVDIGGIYLQLWVGVVYLFIYLLSGITLFQVAFLSVIVSCCISFNPLVKFDGYWIVTDLLDIANLSRQPTRLLKYCYQAIRQKTREPLPWSPMTSTVIGIYGLLRAAMWVGFLVLLQPIVVQAIQQYPALVLHIGYDMQTRAYIQLTTDIQHIVYTSILLLICGVQLKFLCMPLYANMSRLFHHDLTWKNGRRNKIGGNH